MLRLLQWIFIGHCHTWEKIKEVHVWDRTDAKYPVEVRAVCACKKCGTLKTFTFEPS